MKPIKTTLILVFLLSFFHIANTQEKYSKVKVYYPVSDIELRNNLIRLLQIDHFVEDKGAVISEVNASLLIKLDALNIKYEVLIDDMVKNLETLNKEYYASLKNPSANRVAIEQPGNPVDTIISTPAAFEVKSTFGGYYNFAEMNTAINALVASYGSIAQKISIGTTAMGRNIWLMKISDNVTTDEANEPEILYMGLQHAREAITGSSMIFFMQYLCENYATDYRIKDLVDNREIYIIPCFNPDGWEYNRTSSPEGGTPTGGTPGGDWRKNRRNNGDGTYGVDLNRNWGVDWNDCDPPILGNVSSCGSSDTGDDTYWGTAAFSEPETQAVRAFVKEHHIVTAFDQHSYGPYYSLPFGRHSKHSMTTKGKNFFTAIPALMGTYNGMRAGDSYEALHYEVAGGFKDWMLIGELGSSSGSGLKDTVWAMTGEGAAGGGSSNSYAVSNGTQSFWAPASQIISLCKGMCYQNLQLAYAAGTYVDIQDAGDIMLTSSSGNLSFTIKRLGLGNDPVTVSLVPIENILAAGPPVTINSLSYYEDYTASISYTLPPALPNGQRVKFAWKVQTGGYTYSDTVIKFLNPAQLFYDDMESSDITTNWVVSGGWNYSADDKFGGTKSLTESPGSNYSANSSLTARCKKTFDLTNATAAYITFWTKHRAENFRDKLQLQVSINSTNGTNGTWTAIAGSTTVQEPGTLDNATINGQPALTGIRDYWTREVYDLDAYRGSGAGTFRFRFVFTSDNDPTTFAFERDEGFYIDNLKVIKSTSALITLPVHFISFTGRLLSDETFRLDWNAVTDQQDNYFEVEKSANGTDFISIGRGPSSAPYWKIDPSPYIGNNFYRIKQMDNNGTITYSHTINIYYNPEKFTAFVYPNPVINMLNVKISSKRIDQYTISISDLAGRKVHEEKVITGSGGREISINFKQQAAEIYILTIRNGKNELVATQKIAKQ